MTSIFHLDEPAGNEVRARLDAVVGRGQRTYTPSLAVVDWAQGSRIRTVDGRMLYDLASGVLVANLGHGHRLFESQVAAYSSRLPRNAYNMATPIEALAAERIVHSMRSNPKAQKVLWAATGSEAIQKAMWCALHREPDRPYMAATRGGFHGKKGLAGDVTGETSSNPFVRFISFPMYEEKPPSFYRDELDGLSEELGDRIALLITEPYLGAKGSFHPPKWYHVLLETWCEKHGLAFIFDEVQSCHGRTGNMYAFETYGVAPDLVVLGKGLANGEPAAAVVGRADLIDSLDYGEGSDTFSGNPRACAAICATFDVFEEEHVVEHCRAVSPCLERHLATLEKRFPFVKHVRGEGLVFGVEMVNTEIAKRCVLEAYRGNGDEGVHFLGPLAGTVLRVSPSLIITEDELDQAFKLVETAWARIV
jgi:4-aminobutyrate aminotransferase-like enzyme